MWIQSHAQDIGGTKTKQQKLRSPLSPSYLRWVTWITTCTNRHQSNMWCDTKPSHSLTKLANLLNDRTTEYRLTVNNSIRTISIRTRQFNCDKNVKLNQYIGPRVKIYHQFISTTTENMFVAPATSYRFDSTLFFKFLLSQSMCWNERYSIMLIYELNLMPNSIIASWSINICETDAPLPFSIQSTRFSCNTVLQSIIDLMSLPKKYCATHHPWHFISSLVT
jgi:hypothetical protein